MNIYVEDMKNPAPEQVQQAVYNTFEDAVFAVSEGLEKLNIPVDQGTVIMCNAMVKQLHRLISTLNVLKGDTYSEVALALHDDAKSKLSAPLLTLEQLMQKQKVKPSIEELLASIGVEIEGVEIYSLDEFLNNEINKKD